DHLRVDEEYAAGGEKSGISCRELGIGIVLRDSALHYKIKILTKTEQHTVTYPVMEHFYTLQGEGVYTGNAAYFIRLGGCDVGCTWCDVKDSWDAGKHPLVLISDMVQLVRDAGANLAV